MCRLTKHFCLLTLVGSWGIPTPGSAQPPDVVEFSAQGRLQTGLRLIRQRDGSVIMGRDGWLHAIDAAGSGPIQPVDHGYEPLSAAELRNRLRSEFRNGFEVSATPHFLVVQPRGRGRRWPDLFEQSHRAFISYLGKRGVRIREGRFPMVAVVYPDRSSMFSAFRSLDIDVSRVAGVYSNQSNRVMTHDGGRYERIASTVRHEAAHQSAFNSGVHSRVNDTPQWITEGLGQMFEPPAMAEPARTSRLRDRVNAESLKVLAGRFDVRRGPEFSAAVTDLVRSDAMFEDRDRVDEAYAVSWAMMFFLAERQPESFAGLLNFTATRPPFRTYTAGQRMIDFERVVGCDLIAFSSRVHWFIASLR